jgi:hypothetical protein
MEDGMAFRMQLADWLELSESSGHFDFDFSGYLRLGL